MRSHIDHSLQTENLLDSRQSGLVRKNDVVPDTFGSLDCDCREPHQVVDHWGLLPIVDVTLVENDIVFIAELLDLRLEVLTRRTPLSGVVVQNLHERLSSGSGVTGLA